MRGPAANGVGVNAFRLAGADENGIRFMAAASLAKGSGERVIAQTQTHHTIMDRLVVQDATLASTRKTPRR